MKSDDYINRCVEVILNDKNLSETTITIMFLEYKRLIFEESKYYGKNDKNKIQSPTNRR